MKQLQKLLGLLLALAMVLSLTATAFASTVSNNGSITIQNPVAGQTYTIYQIFSLESYADVPASPTDELGNPTGGKYVYKVTDAWKAFFQEAEGSTPAGAGRSYVEIDNQGHVTWKTGASVEDFARAARAFITTSITNQGQATAEDGNTAVKFENLSLGYYLVDSSMGILCALDTTNPNVTMKEKNEQPTIVKKVQENSKADQDDGGWGEKNDASVGDTVNFKTTITVKAGAENYVMHDKMDNGFTFTAANNIVVQVGDTTLTASAGTNSPYSNDNPTGYVYEVKTTGLESSDPCTFHIEFVQAYLDTLTAGTEIVITYSAALDKDAVNAATGSLNKTWMGFGDNSTTESDTTTTYTWSASVLKFTQGEDTTKTPLENAKFELLKSDMSTKVSLVKTKDGSVTDPKSADEYRVAQNSETGNSEITTNSTGTFSIKGLDAGTYYLKETTPPAGYNRLTGPIQVVITSVSDGTDTKPAGTVEYYNHNGETGADEPKYDTNPTGKGTIEVENKTGLELPSTGGMGTTIFYVVGSILLVGAGVLLVTKKRMSSER